MVVELINLRTERKRRERAKREAAAAENRAAHGRTRAERSAEAAEIARGDARLDGAKRDI